MNQYVKQYQKSSIETATREQILIMLYDGAIQFLNKAKISLNKKDYENSHNNLMGAQRIIEEFINSLDREIAPQLADNLISLYEYFIRRLIHANMKKDISAIDEVLTYLKSLKATWEQAIAINQKEQAKEAKKSHYDNYDSDDDDEDDDEEDDDDDEEEDE